MLYLVPIVIIFLRLLLIEVTPAEMGPTYWIAMGATAISVRAAARIFTLHGPHARVLVAVLQPFVVGVSVVLWAFGTWWIPLMVLLGIWRYMLRRYPRTYEPRLWNMVFPSACIPPPLSAWARSPASGSRHRLPGCGSESAWSPGWSCSA